jgi:hypothetical protein
MLAVAGLGLGVQKLGAPTGKAPLRVRGMGVRVGLNRQAEHRRQIVAHPIPSIGISCSSPARDEPLTGSSRWPLASHHGGVM